MDEFGSIAQPHAEIYESLFRAANPGGLPTINGASAALFLRKFNVEQTTLGQIWEIADYQKKGILDKRGFFMAFKLVAAAQQGLPISPEVLHNSTLGPPRLPSASEHHQPVDMPTRPPSVPQTPVGWAISSNEQAKYDSIFESLNPENGKITGAKVRPVLFNSGLDAKRLAKIWDLSDQDKDGALDRIEMAVALHLVYSSLQNVPLPHSLPDNLIHPSKMQFRHMSNVPGACGVAGSRLNNAVRSRAGSVSSLDGIGFSHVATGIGVIPAGGCDRSASAHPYFAGSGSNSICSIATPSEDWPVDRLSCAAQFAACDADCDGLVSGLDVRSVLMASGLPQPSLALIWELADIQKTGVLNQEQFALCMHLIQMKRNGEELPSVLPSHLIPPSLRKSVVENGTMNVIVSSSESANPEIKQLCEDMEKLTTERRETDLRVEQLEADMSVKSSTIKNLQIELQTLETTVKQLERQKAEASRRLGELDDQINHLISASAAQYTKADEARARLEQLKLETENGMANAANDMTIVADAQTESARLEAEALELASAIDEEQRTFESSIGLMTKAETQTHRDQGRQTTLASETLRVQKAMSELQSALESTNALELIQQKMQLLGSFETPELMTPINNVTPSTSFTSTEAYTSSGHVKVHDPFANTDPFAAAPGADYSSGFPCDPFSSAAAAENSEKLPLSTAPPPRPAPPKSARQTPVNTDPFANIDPFGSNTSANSSAGFADFSNFGAFG